MLQFRFTLVALIGWLFVFYNIERIHEPLNIASFVYVLSALGSALLILTGGSANGSANGPANGSANGPANGPTANQYRLAMACVGSFLLLLVLKAHWNYPIAGAALPITVTEVVAMSVTFMLASWLSEGVQRFEEGSFQLTMAQEREGFEQEQTVMYGEVRRAREFQRPLTVAYIRGDTREFEQALHPLIVQSQRAAAERYARAKIAAAIGQELRDCDMFAIHDDGFVLVLPEADRCDADLLLKRVTQSLSEQFNLQVEAGLASMPDEQVTFSGLLEHAMKDAESASVDGSASDSPADGASDPRPITDDAAQEDSGIPLQDAKYKLPVVAGRAARRFFDPTLAITLNLQGRAEAVEAYLQQLRTDFGDRWYSQINGAPAAMVIDMELTDEPFSPPADAVAMGGDWFRDSTLYRPLEGGWVRLGWEGGDRWSLTRTATAQRDLSIEQAMFRISSLRGGGLPLHASVGRLHDFGIAALGSAESGKTAVLLALLELGGQWICDDEAYCESDLVTAHGTASEIHVKQRYLAQLPELSRRVRRKDRWNQRFSTAARRVAAGASMVPAVPMSLRRRLRRMADGQVSTPMSPPGRLPATPVDIAMIVTSGQAPQLEALDPATWSARAAEILWPEVRDFHELHRRMQAATGGELVAGEVEDEARLRNRILNFALNKRTYQLVRSPQMPLESLSKMLAGVWDEMEATPRDMLVENLACQMLGEPDGG